MQDRSILVVDDSRTMTAIIARILKEANYASVEVVHDGEAALAKLREKPFDLVITDWEMAPLDGPALIKRIRADAALAHVRTILLTALQGKEDDAWFGGADGYVTKPFAPRDLTEKIEYVLGEGR